MATEPMIAVTLSKPTHAFTTETITDWIARFVPDTSHYAVGPDDSLIREREPAREAFQDQGWLDAC